MTTEYIHLKGSFAIGNTLQAAGFPGASLADDIVIPGYGHTGVSIYTEWKHGGVGRWLLRARR